MRELSCHGCRCHLLLTRAQCSSPLPGGELDPEATLEASLDALNVRKFDLAFAVDPLFHKTSAQFDEGGAKGLLLANLSVYAGCDIVFDSMDVPEEAVDAAALAAPPAAEAATVDLSGISPAALAALAAGGTGGSAQQQRLSPTLDAILGLLGQAPPPDAAAAADAFVAQVAEAAGDVVPTQSLAAHFRPAAAAAAAEGEEPAAMDADAPPPAEDGDASEGVAPEYAYADGAGAPADDDYSGGGGELSGGKATQQPQDLGSARLLCRTINSCCAHLLACPHDQLRAQLSFSPASSPIAHPTVRL